MTFCFKLFDKSIFNKSKYNHLISQSQKTLDEFIIRRHIILNPIFDQVYEIMKIYFKIIKKI